MENEIESEAVQKRIPHWRLMIDQSRITPAVMTHKYEGSGTEVSPFIVSWIPNDPGNPMEFPTFKKWALSGIGAVSMLAVAFSSSAFSGGLAGPEISSDLC
jgi:hypothetical protein